MGARVGIVGRDRTRTEAAAAAIARETGNDAIDVFVGDLSSQAEVRRVAAEVPPHILGWTYSSTTSAASGPTVT